MAAFATARPALSFHIQPPFPPPHAKLGRTHFLLHLPTLKSPITSLSSFPLHLHRALFYHRSALASVDVSKEDKPLSEQDQPPSTTTLPPTGDSTPEAAESAAAVEGSEEEDGEEGKFDRRRLEERFVVLNTGIYDCRSCGFRYDQAVGDPSYPIPPGLSFEKLPEDWRCPTCGAAQSFFESKSVEIAGFAQNQQFGLGGNSLTSGQKATLIYGTLLFFFVLFLLGYFLQ